MLEKSQKFRCTLHHLCHHCLQSVKAVSETSNRLHLLHFLPMRQTAMHILAPAAALGIPQPDLLAGVCYYLRSCKAILVHIKLSCNG